MDKLVFCCRWITKSDSEWTSKSSRCTFLGSNADLNYSTYVVKDLLSDFPCIHLHTLVSEHLKLEEMKLPVKMRLIIFRESVITVNVMRNISTSSLSSISLRVEIHKHQHVNKENCSQHNSCQNSRVIFLFSTSFLLLPVVVVVHETSQKRDKWGKEKAENTLKSILPSHNRVCSFVCGWWCLCFWYRWCLKLCDGSKPECNALITQFKRWSFW